MDLEQLNIDLAILGTVNKLEEVGGVLLVSIFIGEVTQVIQDSFLTIADTQIKIDYPVVEVVSFEGNAIKAIYCKL